MMETLIVILVAALVVFLLWRHLRQVVDVKVCEEPSSTLPPEPKIESDSELESEEDPAEAEEEEGVVPVIGEVAVMADPEPEPETEEPEAPIMIDKRSILHLEPHRDGGWQVRNEHAKRPLRVFAKKPEALAYAKTKAKSKAVSTSKTALLVIHKRDGSVQNEHAYDGDK